MSSILPNMASKKVKEYEVKLVGARSVTVRLDFAAQHTMSWSDPVERYTPVLPINDSGSPARTEPLVLGAGSCCLYTFPKVLFVKGGHNGAPNRPREPTIPQVALLIQILLELARPPCDFMSVEDEVGATPILALLVANTDASLQASLTIFRRVPTVMLSAHGPGPFTGENTLHVVIVNRHERMVLDMEDISFEHFDRQQLKSFYLAQAAGGFFRELPMRYYGGTPVGYMTAFSMSKPIAVLCCQCLLMEKMHGLIDINHHAHACRTTGYLPLHVAVVNGLTSMYDFLTNFRNAGGGCETARNRTISASTNGPHWPKPRWKRRRMAARFSSVHIRHAVWIEAARDFSLVAPGAHEFCPPRCTGHMRQLHHFRADPTAISGRRGVLTDHAGLSSLQLSAMMGDRRMYQFILKHTARILWVWGPVTQYQLSLSGIDSSGVFSHDVMDVVGALDATRETQELLLDCVMQGFLFKLFVQKWKRWGRWMYLCNRLSDLTVIAALATLAFKLKLSERNQMPHQWLIYTALLCPLPMICEDVRVAVLWFRNLRAETTAADKADTPEATTGARLEARKHWAVAGTSVLAQKRAGGLAGRLRPTTLHKRSVASQSVETLDADILRRDQLRRHAVYWRVLLRHLRLLLRWMVVHKMHLKLLSTALSWTTCMWMLAVGVSPEQWDYLWLALGLSLFCFAQYFLSAIFAPHEKLGILWLTTLEIASNDCVHFLILFGAFLINYGVAMYITFPKAGDADDPLEHMLPQFSTPLTSFQAMIELATIGMGFELDLRDMGVWVEQNSVAKIVSFIFFCGFYLLYIIMSLILLLNLLIAMMGDRFGTIMQDAELKHRVGYARRMLRLELQCHFLSQPPTVFGRPLWPAVDLRAGDRIGLDYFVCFRNVQANTEGRGTMGSSLVFSADVEEPNHSITAGYRKESLELKQAIAQLAGEATEAAPSKPPLEALVTSSAAANEGGGEETRSMHSLLAAATEAELGSRRDGQWLSKLLDDVRAGGWEDEGDSSEALQSWTRCGAKVTMAMHLSEEPDRRALTSAGGGARRRVSD